MWHHIFKLGGNGGSLWGRTLMCIMASASKAVRKASELVTASGLENIRSLWKQRDQEMLLVPDDQGHWLCYLQSPSGETMGHVCAPNSGTLSAVSVWLGDCILQMPLLHSHRLWRCAAQPCASLSLSWELYWFYNNPQVGLHSLVVLLRVRWCSGAGGAMCSLSLPSPGHESHSSGFPALCSLHPLPRLGFSNVWLWSAFWSWTALRKKKGAFDPCFLNFNNANFPSITKLFFLCPFSVHLLFMFEVFISLLPSAGDEGLAPSYTCYSWRCVLGELGCRVRFELAGLLHCK